jgi:hypothetical protein
MTIGIYDRRPVGQMTCSETEPESARGGADAPVANRSASDSAIGGAGDSQDSSRAWTQSRGAAALVVRYLLPMRGQLAESLGSDSAADIALRMLISHLITEGFGSHGRGRLRDFLMRGMRSAARAIVAELPADRRPEIDFSTWRGDDPKWVSRWRAEILARAWRELERNEHRDLSRPVFTILRAAVGHPKETAEMLAVRVNTESDVVVQPSTIRALIGPARRRFAELLLREIRMTLEQNDDASVRGELTAIGIDIPVDRWIQAG